MIEGFFHINAYINLFFALMIYYLYLLMIYNEFEIIENLFFFSTMNVCKICLIWKIREIKK